jgi:hypothetical protein
VCVCGVQAGKVARTEPAAQPVAARSTHRQPHPHTHSHTSTDRQTVRQGQRATHARILFGALPLPPPMMQIAFSFTAPSNLWPCV